MTNPSYYMREATVKITHGAGSKTWRENSSGRVMTVEFDVTESRAFLVTIRFDNTSPTSTNNLLDADYNGWSSGTGAVAEGDKLELGYYRAGNLNSMDWYFDGYVVRANEDENHILTIQAYDPSKALDNRKIDTVIYKNLKNRQWITCTDSNGDRYIGITDDNICLPFAYVAVSEETANEELGNSATAGTQKELNTDPMNQVVAQSFIAKEDNLKGIDFYIHSNNYGGVQAGTMRFKLYRDNGHNDFGALITEDYFQLTHKTEQEWDGGPGRHDLEKGAKYWVTLACYATGFGGTVHCDASAPVVTNSATCKYSSNAGSTWSWVANTQLRINLQYWKMTEKAPKEYWYDTANKKIWMLNHKNNPADSGWNWGVVSYYYNYLQLKDIIDRLIKFDTGLIGDICSPLVKNFFTYATRGKSIGDCLRELLDVYEDSGDWSGFQHVMMFYRDASGYPYMRFGKRYALTDTEVAIYSYPPDHGANDEWCIESINLENTIRMKYSEVQVTGKSLQDEPIIAVRSDRGKTDSFYNKMHGLAEKLVVTDDNIFSYNDCDSLAIKYLDMCNRDVWSGSITLAGHHLHLFDFDKLNATMGSGKILKLYYSPLGIEGVKMKVSRLIFRSDGTTEVFVNNLDPSLDNKWTRGLGTIDKLEGFLSPIGLAENVFLRVHEDSNIYIDHDVYMQLYDANNVALLAQDPVLCTKKVSSRYNSCTYHAEFEKGNGYSDQGVRYVELYTAEHGTIIKYDLMLTVSSIPKNLSTIKFISNRLIVEFTGEQS